MRFLTALDMTHPNKIEDTSRALWMRIWSRVSVHIFLAIIKDILVPKVSESSNILLIIPIITYLFV